MNGVNMCTTCMARHFDSQKGIVCSTTGEKCTCEGYCQNYQKDESKIQDDAYVHNRWRKISKPFWLQIILTLMLVRGLVFVLKLMTIGFISM